MINNVVSWLEDDKNKAKFIVIHAGIILFYILYYYVVCQSSYMADDMYNSNALGLAYMQNDSVWSLTYRQWIRWIDAGRFFPFSNYVYIMFYFVPGRFAYKLLLVIVTYLNSLLFGRCVSKIMHSKEAGLLSIILFPLCMQLTGEFDDGIYCFHMLIQMTFIWLLLSLLCTLRFIDKTRMIKAGELPAGKTGRSRWVYYVLSAVFLVCSLGTYEVAFVLVAFIGLAVWGYTGKFLETLKVLIPDFIAYGAIIVVNLILRANMADVGYDGISINLQPGIVIETFLKQLLSTLPLNRFISRTKLYGVPYSKAELLANFRIRDIVMVCIYLALVTALAVMFYKNVKKIKNYVFTILGALSLMVLPAALISITFKYQEILDWGTNHISAYIQSFGLVLLIVCLLALLVKHAPKKVSAVIIGLLVLINIPVMLLQEMESRTSVYYNNLNHRFAVENIANSAEIGIFDDINREDTLLCTSDYYFDAAESKTFYCKYAKKEIEAVESPLVYEKLNELRKTSSMANAVYAVSSDVTATECGTLGIDHGFVVLQRISDYKLNSSKEEYALHTNQIKVYVESNKTVIVNYTENSIEKTIDLSSLTPVKTSDDGKRKLYVIDVNKAETASVSVHEAN